MLYDVELDLPIFYVKLFFSTNGSEILPQPSWFIVDNTTITDSVKVSVIGPANNWVSQYYIEVVLQDAFNTNTTNNTYVNLTIQHNYAPVAITNFTTNFSSTIPWPFNYTLNTAVFNDSEGDAVLITCVCTTNATANDVSWTHYVYNSVLKTLYFSGTPPLLNTYAGNYLFTCSVFDPYDALPNLYNFTLTLNPKSRTNVTTIIPKQYTRVPDNLTIYANGTFYDPEVQTITMTVKINGTVIDSSFSSWINWNATS